jgi:hypothetical protein
MMAARFSVQSALTEMRQEQREDMQALQTSQNHLMDKVTEGFKTATKMVTDHVLEDTTKFNVIDKRLDLVENTRRTMRWLLAAAVVAFLGATAEFVVNHLGHVIQ